MFQNTRTVPLFYSALSNFPHDKKAAASAMFKAESYTPFVAMPGSSESKLGIFYCYVGYYCTAELHSLQSADFMFQICFILPALLPFPPCGTSFSWLLRLSGGELIYGNRESLLLHWQGQG